jgi:hypothetical protein
VPTFDQFDDALSRTAGRTRASIEALAKQSFPQYTAAARSAGRENRSLADSLKNLSREHGIAADLAKKHGTQLRELEKQQKELERHYRTVRGVAVGAYAGMTGLAMGLVRTGLQGTVEGYRLEYAWTRLGRSMAAVALPAFEKLADWMGRVAGWFERLTGRQQDFLLKLGLVAVVAAPAIAAFRTLLTLGTAVFALGRGAAAAAGAGAASSGVAAAAGSHRMTGAAMMARGGLGGAAAAGGLMRFAGPVGMAAAGGVALAQSGGLRLNASEGPTDQYARLRQSGRSRLGAGFEVAGTAMGFLGRELFGGEEEFIEGNKKKRRDVQAMGFASEEAGGAHMRIQEELLKVSVAKAGEAIQRMEDEAAARAKLIEQMEREAAVRGFSKASGLPGFVGVGVSSIGGFDNSTTSGALLHMFDADRLKKIMGK